MNTFKNNDTRNIILTGVPRSASTLILKLLGGEDQAVCLDEPDWLKEIRSKTPKKNLIPQQIYQCLSDLRRDVQSGKKIKLNFSKNTGKISENHFERSDNAIIKTKLTQKVLISQEMFESFWIVKSNVFFTAIIDLLINSGEFKIIATIRNPISVIMSWRSLEFSLSRGKSMIAEKYNEEFKAIHSHPNLLVRQVLIADWFYKKYKLFENKIEVLKYEEWVEDIQVLSQIYPGLRIQSNLELENKNNSNQYNQGEYEQIKCALKQYGEHYKYFYPAI